MQKRALCVWGGWDGHEPEQCTNIAADILMQEGFVVQVSNSQEVFTDQDLMSRINLLVPCLTMTEIKPEQTKGLLQAIQNGAGIAGWHGGMGDTFRNDTEYQFMVGGQFVAHPGGIVDYQVNIADHDDPITKGIGDFSIRSEKYYMHVDPSNQVLATISFNGQKDKIEWIDECIMPAVWKRRFGQGRVFYCSLGHVADDFKSPQLREILRRGMLWAAS